MHNELKINQIIISAITSASAILIPILFHLLGLGSVFLPMFIPLSVGSFFVSPGFAFLIGFISPIISAILTGMPPIYPPIAFIMMFELSLFCFIISFLKHKFNLNHYLILIIAIFIDRIILYTIYAIILPYFGISFMIFSLYDLLKSLPGIFLIIILTPTFVKVIRNYLKNTNTHL